MFDGFVKSRPDTIIVIPANPPREDKSWNPVLPKSYGLRLLSASGGFAGVTGFRTFYDLIMFKGDG